MFSRERIAALIQPTYDTGFDGTMVNWVFAAQNNLLNGWAYPLSTEMRRGPRPIDCTSSVRWSNARPFG